ncbi:MAG: hypothetical protein C4K60_03950 [Ideonella sp. MAG2]|nr:MAG: hypothetical protein C4K60_03950 [Ideonella sp. MAG2]
MVVVMLMAILAAAAIPTRSAIEPDLLDAAAGEVRSALRFAREQVILQGSPVLVDMETQANTVKVRWGTCKNPGALLTDPRTRQSMVLALNRSPLTKAMTLDAQVLLADGNRHRGLVFDATGSISQACAVASESNKGAPVQGSQVVLKLETRERVVSLWPATGRVSGP